MATEDGVPSVQELIVVSVEALKRLGGSGSNEEIDDEVAGLLKLPDEILEISHSETRNDTRFGYRMRWARTYLKKVGAVDNTQRGLWTLTEKGRQMTSAELQEVRKVVAEMGRRKRKEERTEEPASDGDEDTEEAEEELGWKERLLRLLQNIAPDAFERLCQRVLREAGFTRVEVTGRSGDGGIDGHGVLRVKLVSFQVLFQCKRYKDTVSSPVIRDFRGAMQGRADKGLIMTTGRFTADARKEATRDGAPAIDLIDGDELCDLLKELKIGVKTEFVERVDIDESVFATI